MLNSKLNISQNELICLSSKTFKYTEYIQVLTEVLALKKLSGAHILQGIVMCTSEGQK